MMRSSRKRLAELQARTMHEVGVVEAMMRQGADDPDVTDAALRSTLRDGANIVHHLVELNATTTTQLERAGRRFGWLALAYLALIVWQGVQWWLS